MSSFIDLGVPADLAAALSSRGIDSPFPVQAATIPDQLAGRDVCGRAPTGSGKTLAFGLPLVERVGRSKPNRPRALVLAPTRELAAQIERELAPLAKVRGRRVFSVYGGVGYDPQRRNLRRGVDILVACPGRLEDLIEQRVVDLSIVEIVVIDEADRMADMGFLPAVKRILDATAEKRQTVLFSATLDGDVAVLTKKYQHDPARHEVEGVENDGMDAEHRFEAVEFHDRADAHRRGDRRRGRDDRVLPDPSRGRQARQEARAPPACRAAPIHGGLSQNKRDRALQAFQRGSVQALIATDVAARGIHVDDVACVVHFDPPEDAKTYVHRSGRTARKGASGVVISFVGADQQRDSRKMRRELGFETGPEPHRPSGARQHRARPARNRSRQRRTSSGR